MAIGVFAFLALGKTSFILQDFFETAGFAAVDLATTIYNELPLTAAPSASESNIQPKSPNAQRVGSPSGYCEALPGRFITSHSSRVMLVPFGSWSRCATINEYHFFQPFLIAGVMPQAHRDRRPTIFVWYCASMSCGVLGIFGVNSPNLRWVYMLGGYLQLLIGTVGIYFVVMHVEKKAEQCDVAHGYTFMVGNCMGVIQDFTLWITSLKQGLNVYVVSCALMGFQKIYLKLFVPMCKKCLGDDDDRRLWSYPIPAMMLALELRPCLLLLSEDITSWKFWGLLMWQELNSVAKNTGTYGDLYVVVRSRLGRPVNDEAHKLMEELRAIRRRVITLPRLCLPLL